MKIVSGVFSMRSRGTSCLLYTSDAADERSSVDLGGRRIIKKKNKQYYVAHGPTHQKKNRQEHHY